MRKINKKQKNKNKDKNKMNTEQKALLLQKLKRVYEEVKNESNDEEFIKYVDFKAETFDLEIKLPDTLEPQAKKTKTTKYSEYLVDGNYFCKFCNKSISIELQETLRDIFSQEFRESF